MVIRTDSERVRLSRRMVLEFLASSVDVSTAPELQAYLERYGGQPERFGPAAPSAAAGEPETAQAGAHCPTDGRTAATVAQPVKIDNDLYIRDYGKCILCYKCVQACGEEAQNTFAIAVAGRGFDSRISTEYEVPLPDSACVYCGNCIGVCPTGALMFKSEYDMREAGAWKESEQERTDTICPYCGSAAPSPCTCRTTGSSRPPHRSTRSHPRTSLHQGPLRLAVRSREGQEEDRRVKSGEWRVISFASTLPDGFLKDSRRPPVTLGGPSCFFVVLRGSLHFRLFQALYVSLQHSPLFTLH